MVKQLKTEKDGGIEVEALFDYRNISQDQKEAVQEVISFLQERPNVPLEFSLNEIKQKFEMEEIPMLKPEDTLWYEMTKQFALGANIQGFRTKTLEDGSKIKIPYINFSADLEYLNEIMIKLIERSKETK
jgi:hypothetical protein